MMRALLLLTVMLSASGVATADSKTKSRVVVKDKTIEILDQVYFEYGKPVIKPQSYAILDAVAAAIKGDKHLALIEIQGHTDERGAEEYNLEVSDQRAHAIEKYLVDKGVEPKRLRAKGYGESQPLDKGHNEKAWAKNRRMAFAILQRQS